MTIKRQEITEHTHVPHEDCTIIEAYSRRHKHKHSTPHVHPNRIYVASSWRNPMHIAIVAAIQAEGLDCYDFKNPKPGHTGFHWTDVGMPTYELRDGYEVPSVPPDDYLAGIAHLVAQEGFDNDFEAMKDCDTCVLVLPCGRSAHLELGWFVGQGRNTAILLEQEPMIPELMYKMVDYLAPSLVDLLGWLGVQD